MKKRNICLLALSIAAMCACSAPEKSESYNPVGSLQETFAKLQDNNFTVSYTDKFMSYGKERSETKRYTKYAVEAEGDLGDYGIAQGSDEIFKYTVTDGEIVSGLPLVNNDGIRYDSIFDYTYGIDSFDLSYLPTETDENGVYTYTFGENAKNDSIFANVFLIRQIAQGIYPEKTTIKVLGEKLVINSVILSYSGEAFGNNYYEDVVQTIVSNVGTTENKAISKYLSDGKSAKTPLTPKFYQFIAPYLESNNYVITSDSSQMPSINFNGRQIFTENAIINDFEGGTVGGYVLKQGVVAKFNTNSENKVEITGVPVADEYNTLYTALYGGILDYTISMLDYNYFVGYVDEEHENSYIITDSQTIGVLSYVCYCTVSDECYTDRVRIEVVNEETHEFNLYFELRNKNTSLKLGTYVCNFSGLNTTVYDPIDRYLNIGDDASTQNKNTFDTVLQKFKQHNYSLEINNSSVGLVKYCYTKDYFYEFSYLDKSINLGYVRRGSNLINSFTLYNGELTVDDTKNYADGSSPLKMPGTGSYFGAENDLFYFSSFENTAKGISNSDLYNMDNYKVSKFGKYTYWENTKDGFAQAVLDYLTGGTNKILPMGAGFMVTNGKDDYDTRVSLICNYIAADESYTNSFVFTFFDIGTTSVADIETFLNS